VSPWLRACVGRADSWRPRHAGHTFPKAAVGLRDRSQVHRPRGSRGRAVSCMGRRPRVRSDVSRRTAAMPDGWRPQVRTRGLAQDDSRETVAVLHDGAAGPDVWTCRCPGCSTWNPQAMLGSLPPRFETSVLTRMADCGRPLRPTPAGVGHANRPGRPLGRGGVSLQRPTDPECVGVSRGTGVSVPAVDARQYRTRGPVAMREQRCLMREQCGALRRWRSVIRTPTGHQDPRGIPASRMLHVELRATCSS
jgi:hypothetical protein